MRLTLLIISLFVCILTNAQTAILFGKVIDTQKQAIPNSNVIIKGTNEGKQCDDKGNYEIAIPANKNVTLVFSHIGNNTLEQSFNLKEGERLEFSPTLKEIENNLIEVKIEDKETRKSTMTRLDPKLINVIPSSTGGIEAIIKTLPGVVSNNDLSSQYSVRGGNYDENLVYVNDIEIFRPFLVRSGQQEGLSFINGDMVSSILFSAGGFDARYGDKMSSVLDVKYRKPKSFGGSAALGTLGGSVQLEGISKNQKWTFLSGLRQKQNAYLLNSLDVKGNYKPSFTDFQAFVTYEPNKKWEFNFLGNYARNKYLIEPENQQTDVGTVNQALRFTVFFDGKESDIFQNGMGAFSTIYKPNNNLRLKFISSAYKSQESENFDILGQYRLDELENDFGKDDFGKVKFNRGVGSFLNHARNELNASVYNAEHKGFYEKGFNYLQWGVRYQNEFITDELKEWKYVDSAGYAIPQNPSNTVNMFESYRASNTLSSNRISGYFQNSFAFSDSSIYKLSAGVRFNYWDLNNQLVLSPRATLSVQPKWKHDMVFRFSSGLYYQPPFYRELRDLNGNLNKNIKAQQSIHFVAAMDYNLKIWNRPFKLISEVYYKHLNNLIPYQIDNVRIRYFAENNAVGYARGIDIKLNGEFVKGIESWASLSVMSTQEDIKNDFYYDYYNAAGEKIFVGYNFDQVKTDSILIKPGYIPRPTDQRVSFSMFFQDYIPRFPSYKMSLNLLFGSGLPFGPPDYNRYKQTLRYPFYRRVDLGMSKQLLSEGHELRPKSPFRHFKSIWLGIDIFNLLGVNNVVSYNWIKDVTNRQYGIPNYLSARLINVRLQISF